MFKELLHYLKGYPIEVHNETHRATLLKEARYFHFKGLEQRLLPYEISFNASSKNSEIFLRLEDIRQSGISFATDTSISNQNNESFSHLSRNAKASTTASSNSSTGIVRYSRPYVDDEAYDLVIETSDAATILNLEEMRVVFSGQTKARVASLLQIMVNKMNLPATQPLGLMLMTTGSGLAAQPASPSLSGLSNDRIRVRFDTSTHIQLDGETLDPASSSSLTAPLSSSSHTLNHLNSRVAEESSGHGNSAAQMAAGPTERPSKRRKLGSVGVIQNDENVQTNSNNTHASGDVTMNRELEKDDDDVKATDVRKNAYSIPATLRAQPASANVENLKTWTIVRAQWRIRVEATAGRGGTSGSGADVGADVLSDGNPSGVEVVFCAVRLDALSGERARNARRGFLT